MTFTWIRASLAGLVLLLPLGAWSEDALSGIHVSGVGEVRVVPDMARLTLEVRREGTDAARLKSELDQVTAATLDLTRELDIPERHVTAAAVSIHPRYHHPRQGEPEQDGLIASRTIEVTVEQLDLLGELINGALERGANGVRDVQLDATNRTSLEQRALKLAIDDAVQEARRMAEHFEVELGLLKNASASRNQPQPMMRMTSMAESDGTPDSFAPGEMVIRRDVQATFGIRR